MPSPQSLMFLPFLEQLRGMPGAAASLPSLSPMSKSNVSAVLSATCQQQQRTHFHVCSQLMPQVVPASWVSATAQLAHMSAVAGDKAGSPSPPPQSSTQPPPSATPPTAASHSDPDAPLNLSKPKGSSPSPGASSASSVGPAGLGTLGEQPVPATAPKLLPPGLVMPRPFLAYAGLPPHMNPLTPTGK